MRGGDVVERQLGGDEHPQPPGPRVVEQVLAQKVGVDRPFLLNVNIPNRPHADLGPFEVCRLGRRHAAEKVISQDSPRGDTMYWIGGAGAAKDGAEGTDFHATAQGKISVTPLQIDLTHRPQLELLANALGNPKANDSEPDKGQA